MIYTSLFHFSAWFTAFCRIHTPAVLIPGFPAGIQDGLWVLSNLFKSGSSDSKYFIPFCSFPAIFRGIAPLFVLSWRSCFAHPSFLCVCVSVCKWPAAENPCNSLYENSSVFFFFFCMTKEENFFHSWSNCWLSSEIRRHYDFFVYCICASTHTLFLNIL